MNKQNTYRFSKLTTAALAVAILSAGGVAYADEVDGTNDTTVDYFVDPSTTETFDLNESKITQTVSQNVLPELPDVPVVNSSTSEQYTTSDNLTKETQKESTNSSASHTQEPSTDTSAPEVAHSTDKINTQPETSRTQEESSEQLPVQQNESQVAKTTDEANAQGISQVGTVSSSTGQVVRDVTVDQPLETDTGFTIVGTEEGQVIIQNADGSTEKVSPDKVGGTTNEDQTITVTNSKGEKETLPKTPVKDNLWLTFIGSLLAFIGIKFIGYREASFEIERLDY